MKQRTQTSLLVFSSLFSGILIIFGLLSYAISGSAFGYILIILGLAGFALSIFALLYLTYSYLKKERKEE